MLPAASIILGLVLVPMKPGDHTAEWALLIFAWVTGAAATTGWLARQPGARGVATAAAFLLPAGIGYVWLVSTRHRIPHPDLPAVALPTTTTWLITGTALAILGGPAAAPRAPSAARFQKALYARALSAGHITPPHKHFPPT